MTERELDLVFQAPWGPTFVVLALAVAVIVLVLSAFGCRRLPRAAAAALLSLRTLAVLCALAVFLQPAVRAYRVRRTPGRIAMLLDGSLSMTVRDNGGGRSRWQRALAAVAPPGPKPLSWEEDRPVDWFTFQATLVPVDLAKLPAPSGGSTRIVEALDALADLSIDDLGGIVLVSDGIDHGRLRGRPREEAARIATRLGVPVHVIWAGRPGLRDVSIAALRRDDLAFVRTPFKIEADVRATGYQGEATVQLLRDGRAVATGTVALDATTSTVPFEVVPEHVGEAAYAVLVDPRPDEAVVENNRRSFIVRVVRDRTRVLHVSGRPSWDERFLRGLLKREPNIDLISFFILRTPLDARFGNPAELSLIPFPTDELFEDELSGFDLLILQNFQHAPYGLERHLPRVRRWVEQGGGLAVIGGDLAFSGGGWHGTPVAEVLPLEIPPAHRGGTVAGEFRARLREGVERHPIARLGGPASAARSAWDRLPALQGANRLGRPLDGGIVLADGPPVRGGGERVPLLAVREAGAGRTLLLGTDSSWHWSFLDVEAGGDGRAYQEFWRTAIRWLIHDPELEHVRIDLPRDSFAPGDVVAATIRVYDEGFAPAPNVAVTIKTIPLDGPSQPFRTSPVSDASGKVRVEIPPSAPGTFRLSARATVGSRTSESTRSFVVEASGEELGQPEARDDLLRMLADESGGAFREAGESLQGLRFLPSRRIQREAQRDLEIWSGFPMLLVALAALFGEWGLRRRWSLH